MSLERLANILVKCAARVTGGRNVTFEFARNAKLVTASSALGLLGGAEASEATAFQKRRRADALERQREIAAAFDAADVSYAVIKGLSFERVIYGGKALRDVGDIDIMIRPEDALDAHKVLMGMGYSQRFGNTSAASGVDGRASLAVWASRMRLLSTGRPERRFPFKDAYCPYIKLGAVTVELHDGFRGVPRWFTCEIVDRALHSPVHLVLDEYDTLVLLLANTFENAESFYSNCYDDKVALRDFVDLAYFLQNMRDRLDWSKIDRLLLELGLSVKVGRVMKDLDELFPGQFAWAMPNIARLGSLWDQDLLARIVDGDARRRGTLEVLRSSMRASAEKSRTGLVVSFDMESAKTVRVGAGSAPSLTLSKEEGGLLVHVDIPNIPHNGQHLIAVKFYPLDGDGGPIAYCLDILLEREAPVSFLQRQQGMPDGFSVWEHAGREMQSAYGVDNDLAVRMPKSIAGLVLVSGETAIAACLYEHNCENEFWTTCRGKSRLVGDIPIGHLSLYEHGFVAPLFIEFSFGRCVVSACDNMVAGDIRRLFSTCRFGVPVDCDMRVERSYIFNPAGSEGYTLVVGGTCIGNGLSREEAVSTFLQDATDWIVGQLTRSVVVAHAATNFSGDSAVLLMGESGSGKTSLALALAGYWPLGGDECTCIDLAGGTAWCEPLPISVKAGNVDALQRLDAELAVTCVGGVHGVTFAYPSAVVAADPNPSQPRKIRLIAFPSYDPACRAAEVHHLPIEELVGRTLGSLVCKEAPSKVFGKFLGMVSSNGISLVSVRYGNADEAAKALVEYATCMEGHHGV